jgi:hypothetical protein
MTNNIEKLYELAKIEATTIGCTNEDAIDCEGDCIDCTWYDEDEVYPPFSSEKQLELIKWLALNYSQNSILHIDRWNSGKVRFALDREPYYESDYAYVDKDFFQALAGLVCELWEDLTDEQREEIKRILE